MSGNTGLNAFDTTTPFCGNDVSASEIDNPVAKGVCGKCQVSPNGGGGPSLCPDPNSTISVCVTPNSCGDKLYCCSDGRCAKNDADCF